MFRISLWDCSWFMGSFRIPCAESLIEWKNVCLLSGIYSTRWNGQNPEFLSKANLTAEARFKQSFQRSREVNLKKFHFKCPRLIQTKKRATILLSYEAFQPKNWFWCFLLRCRRETGELFRRRTLFELEKREKMWKCFPCALFRTLGTWWKPLSHYRLPPS